MDVTIDDIKTVVDDRMSRTEATFFREIEKIGVKIDKLSDGHNELQERTTRLEGIVAIVNESRKDQGERVGLLETDIAIIKSARVTTTEAFNWLRWGIPVFAGGIAGFIAFMAGRVP
jgi:hypothetical protein